MSPALTPFVFVPQDANDSVAPDGKLGLGMDEATGMPFAVNDAGVPTFTILSAEVISDTILAQVQGSGLVSVTPDDPGNTVTVSVTTEQIQDIIGAAIAATGPLLTVAYDDPSGVTTLTVSGEAVQDVVGTLLQDGSGAIDFTYDDAGNVLTATIKPGSVTAAMVAADVATQAELDAHINATPGAHAASAISSTATGDVAATNVQAAIAELASEKVPTSRILTATAPLTITGGGTLAADRTLAIVPATESVPGSMSALDKAKLGAFIDIREIVTDTTGATDMSTLINNFISGSAFASMVIYVPPNVRVRCDAVSWSTKLVHWRAGSRVTSIIGTGSTTASQFTIGGSAAGPAAGSTIEGLRFEGGTTAAGNIARNAGFAIDLGVCNNATVRDCDINFQWSAIHSGGSLQTIENCNIREYGATTGNGQCILVDGSGDRYIRGITTDNGSNPTGWAGIRVTAAASVTGHSLNIIHAGVGLDVQPPTSGTVPSINVVNSYFDNCVKGLCSTSTGTGIWRRSKFTNCWFGSNSTAGAELNNPGGTEASQSFDGITFDNCDFYLNGIGVSCPTGGGKVQLVNSRVAGNTAGVSLFGSTGFFPQIQNNTIGPQQPVGVNTTGIVVTTGNYRGLVISNNTCHGNTTAMTLGTVTLTGGNAEAGNFRIIDNPGINPKGAVTPPIAAPVTATTYTNATGFRCTVTARAATSIVSFAVNGQVIAGGAATANAFISVTLEPGSTILYTISGVAVWTWAAH